MPTYKNEKQNIEVTKEMLNQYLAHAPTKTKQQRDIFLLSICYLTGARPIELTQLKAKDITEDEKYVRIRLYTAKLGKVRGYSVRERTLIISKESSFIYNILDFARNFPPEAYLLPITTTRIKQIIWGASNKEICPYTLRHSRMASLARREDVGIADLMAWKGSQSAESVNMYIANKPNKPKRID